MQLAVGQLADHPHVAVFVDPQPGFEIGLADFGAEVEHCGQRRWVLVDHQVDLAHIQLRAAAAACETTLTGTEAP